MITSEDINIGDTIIIRGVVTKINKEGKSGFNLVRYITPEGVDAVSRARTVTEVIPAPKPWEPVIGDPVSLFNNQVHKYYYDKIMNKDKLVLVGIFQAEGDPRKWAMVSFKGDIPHSVWFEDLRQR